VYGPPRCAQKAALGGGCGSALSGNLKRRAPARLWLEFCRLCSLESCQDAAVLALAGCDSQADGGMAEEGADCLDRGVSVGCLLDPGELQLNGSLPFVTQRLGGAGWRPLKWTQVAGLRAVTWR
jgi:hypothetical protein